MISIIGHNLIILSVLINFFILVTFYLNIKLKREIYKYLKLLVRLNFLIILLSFFILIFLFMISDFNNLNVFFNSHTAKPLIYKISAAWGNHEGSILLWVLIMNLYSFIFSFNKSLEKNIKCWIILLQSLMILGFTLFLLLTSNPFIVKFVDIEEGMGLNPVLQDPALAIHPPLLYMGYVGYSIVLSIALAGLIRNNLNSNLFKVLKNYSLVCWSFLTMGIGVGAYWAYYELGWGGWWFWDPVENASFMPWLAGLALIHSLIITKENSDLQRWVVFLSILCFSLSLLGTFLVRSGILMSVHAFANDSSRGLFILILFMVITGFSLLIFAFKPQKYNRPRNKLFLNKTTSLIFNNIIMTIACFTVLLGTIYPIIIESLTGERISVGAPYFNNTVLPILLPGVLLMSIAPSISWKNNNDRKFFSYFFYLFFLILFLIFIYLVSNINPWGLIGFGLSFIIIIFSLLGLMKKAFLLKNNNIIEFLQINSSYIAHIGIGILVIGITASSVLKKEFSHNIRINENIAIHKYELVLNKVYSKNINNYQALIGEFMLLKNNFKINTIKPEKRYYHSSKIVTTEAGIYHNFFQDIYIVLGDNNSEFLSIKVYQNPLVSLIWIGCAIIAIGSLLSLRRT